MAADLDSGCADVDSVFDETVLLSVFSAKAGLAAAAVTSPLKATVTANLVAVAEFRFNLFIKLVQSLVSLFTVYCN